MEFPFPLANAFTVYSKSGCPNCVKVKALLKENKKDYTVIDCDEFLLENKPEFLSFIKELSGVEHKTFPMVFHGSRFVGGFTDTIPYLGKILSFGEEEF